MDLIKDITDLKDVVGHNWFVVILGFAVVYLTVTKLAETSEALRKVMGPFGRKILDNYQKRQARYRADVTTEAKALAIELLPKVIPADYNAVKAQLGNIIGRVEELEVANNMLRSFVVYDETWHFQESLAYARSGATRPVDVGKHISWDAFIEKWKTGWRPDDSA